MKRSLLAGLFAPVIAMVVVSTSVSAQTAPPPVVPARPPAAAVQPAAPDCQELALALGRVISNDVRLRDFSNLARYREDNRTLGKPAPGASRVVFMGDSITDSWQQLRFGGFFPGKPYVDRGISGQATPQMLVRFRPDVVELGAKAVVILAGTNDIAANTGPMTNQEIEGNIASMAELATANGISVVLASILPVSEYHAGPTATPQTTTRPLARIKAINDWIQAYVAANGHVYLDYFAAMIDEKGLLRSELSTDDLHPNAQGYAIMAPLAEAAIAKALGSKQPR